MGRLVSLDKGRFIGQRALREEHARGPARQIVGLEIDWNEVERSTTPSGLAPGGRRDRLARRRAGLRDGRQVGKATSTTWSPVLKRMIALATIDRAARRRTGPRCSSR